jgi:hypothetical protein
MQCASLLPGASSHIHRSCHLTKWPSYAYLGKRFGWSLKSQRQHLVVAKMLWNSFEAYFSFLVQSTLKPEILKFDSPSFFLPPQPQSNAPHLSKGYQPYSQPGKSYKGPKCSFYPLVEFPPASDCQRKLPSSASSSKVWMTTDSFK